MNIPQVRAEGCADAVSLGVEVIADLHSVARLALVGVVVGRRLHQERVFTVRVSYLPHIEHKLRPNATDSMPIIQ